MFARNFSRGDIWLPGRVTKRLSAVLFLIQGQSGQTFKQHQDDLRHQPDSDGDNAIAAAVMPGSESILVDPSESPESLVGSSPAIDDETQPSETQSPAAQPQDNNPPLPMTSCYPSRNPSVPDCY